MKFEDENTNNYPLYRMKYTGTISAKQRLALQTSSIKGVYATVPENNELNPDINYWIDLNYSGDDALSHEEIESEILRIINQNN